MSDGIESLFRFWVDSIREIVDTALVTVWGGYVEEQDCACAPPPEVNTIGHVANAFHQTTATLILALPPEPCLILIESTYFLVTFYQQKYTKKMSRR